MIDLFSLGKEILESRGSDLVHLYTSGKSIREVANALGMNYRQVRDALMQAGIPLRPRNVHGKKRGKYRKWRKELLT